VLTIALIIVALALLPAALYGAPFGRQGSIGGCPGGAALPAHRWRCRLGAQSSSAEPAVVDARHCGLVSVVAFWFALHEFNKREDARRETARCLVRPVRRRDTRRRLRCRRSRSATTACARHVDLSKVSDAELDRMIADACKAPNLSPHDRELCNGQAAPNVDSIVDGILAQRH
jgi:hypothetical protein